MEALFNSFDIFFLVSFLGLSHPHKFDSPVDDSWVAVVAVVGLAAVVPDAVGVRGAEGHGDPGRVSEIAMLRQIRVST